MECRQIKELLVSALYADEISSEENQQLQVHIEACTACRQEIATLTGARQALSQWEVDSPPDALVFVAPAPAVGMAVRFKLFFDGWALPAARLAYRGAVALMVLVGFLALLSTEITWEDRKVIVHTRFSPAPANPLKTLKPPTAGGVELVNDSNSRKLSDEELMQWVESRIMEGQLSVHKKLLDLTEARDREQGLQDNQRFVALKREVGQIRKLVLEDGEPSSNQKLNLDKN
ncbi:MAG: zf-HC2 domain-containing protein [Acidobacteria bacterium]|nr:zf-HC2 domain-containing protein [Acidobacteriota bacterium]MBI3658152.1 zf-HC2 domain-containing protein [Acidobacteriota bacterium]